MSRFATKCGWPDPVPCREEFTGPSLYRMQERVLEHLDAIHVHDGRGPDFFVEWSDENGRQRLGRAADVENTKERITDV